jgi:hypothetical protein
MSSSSSWWKSSIARSNMNMWPPEAEECKLLVGNRTWMKSSMCASMSNISPWEWAAAWLLLAGNRKSSNNNKSFLTSNTKLLNTLMNTWLKWREVYTWREV